MTNPPELPKITIKLGQCVDYHHGDGISRAAIIVGFPGKTNALNLYVFGNGARDPVCGSIDNVELWPRDSTGERPARSYSLHAR